MLVVLMIKNLCCLCFIKVQFWYFSALQGVLQMKEILHGEKLASAFGYDVKVIDITGDGLVALLVS